MAMSDKRKLSEAELETLFQAAREAAPVPSEALWARVLADSEAQLPLPAQPEPAVEAKRRPVRQSVRKTGLVAGFVAAIGGWPSMAGLSAATAAGIWIGFSNPQALESWENAGLLPGLDAGASYYDLEDFVPGYDGVSDLLEEG